MSGSFPSDHSPRDVPPRDHSPDARSAARDFIENEQQFHLGMLITEQSHPKTRNLSDVISGDRAALVAGISQLQSVDRDIPRVAAAALASPQWRSLRDAMLVVSAAGGRLRFSGCGSTGRLAVILESMWRRGWLAAAARFPEFARECRTQADLAAGIITGGDRALVKSVESFEDYQSFGARQLRDVGIGPGDLCVAISEGGETSSVIGTAWEALHSRARVFFVYNNPTELLCAHIERSRELIEHPEITCLDLCTGAMALSGSTRMQATTIEMLVVGAALDDALCGGVAALVGQTRANEAGFTPWLPERYGAGFERLLGDLELPQARNALASLVDAEEACYREGGLVTYLANAYLLDVFADTSERTPTFNLPPMRALHEAHETPSWAFPLDPLRSTREAWPAMLLREPRGLSWGPEDYRELGGPARFIAEPPPLATEELYSYPVGREGLALRGAHGVRPTVGVMVTVESSQLLSAPETAMGAEKVPGAATEVFDQVIRLHLGSDSSTGQTFDPTTGGSGDHEHLHIALTCEHRPTDLFFHLSVKLVMNTSSTACMARMGRIYGNYMVQVDPTNKKLVDRATRIIAGRTGLSYDEACYELYRTMLHPELPANRASSAGSPDLSSVAATIQRLSH